MLQINIYSLNQNNQQESTLIAGEFNLKKQ
jgi:hypothetical protein